MAGIVVTFLFAGFGEVVLGLVAELAAECGEVGEAVVVAVEEVAAAAVFEVGQLAGDGGAGAAERACGAADAVVFGDEQEAVDALPGALSAEGGAERLGYAGGVGWRRVRCDEVAASAGLPLAEADIAGLTTGGGHARSLGLTDGSEPRRVSVALAVGDHPVGLLVLQDVELVGRERSLLGTFANQAALALDRAELSEQALRSRLLEEIDRWRSALMGAASHDLRTPLASIKTAVSSLRQVGTQLGPADRSELLELIELQSDRLARLVTNLLDMTRIEAGALELRPIAVAFDELVHEALTSLEGIIGPGRVVVEGPTDLPLLHIDHVLIGQVLANVLENADRLSPDDSVIRVTGRVAPGSGSTQIEIAVSDDGPGIGREERERVFEMFSQNGGGGRAGLGLAIAKAFVEAHGGLIWIDPDIARGARVIFTVPAEAPVPAPV